MDPKATRSWSGDLSYAINEAEGINSSFNKIILGAIYSFPGHFNTSANFKLEYIDLDYTTSTTNRKDTSLSATLSAAKTLTKNLSLAASAQYLTNNSSVDINEYNKSVVSLLLIYGGSVSRK